MSDLLRRQLRLSAARAEPSAYAVGRRVQMHNTNNTVIWRGIILPSTTGTEADRRRIAWDDGMVSTVDVFKLELIGDDE